MRILAVSHDPSLYGAQRSLVDVVIGLASRGHKVEVCVPWQGPVSEILASKNIPTHTVKFSRWIRSFDDRSSSLKYWIWRFPRGVVQACRLIKDGQFDIVYTNTVTVLDFAIAAKLCRIPHVWHLREAASGNPQVISPFSNVTVGKIVRYLSARVIFNSSYLRGRYGASQSVKDVVVFNGIDFADSTLAYSRGRPRGTFTIVTVGYMERRKGLDVLLDALLLVPKELRNVIRVQVAGHIAPDYLKAEIEPRLGRLHGMISMLGWVDNVQEILKTADLLVSSARDEPFGRTIIEAMGVGVPVVATRSGGPEEIIEDGTTGFLVPLDNPQALAESLVELIGNPGLLGAFSTAGRTRVEKVFSLKTCVSGVEACLSQAVRTRS